MISRLPVRTILAALAALAVGGLGALAVLGMLGEGSSANAPTRIVAGYVAWVVLALASFLVLRRYLAARHDRGQAPDVPVETADAAAVETDVPLETADAAAVETDVPVETADAVAVEPDEVPFPAASEPAVEAPPAVRHAFVTGGAGFIGSALTERLLADGWMVTAFDNFDPFYPRERKLRNVAAALGHERYRLFEGDTRDAGVVRAALHDPPPDVVFDLAARAGVRPSIADPAGYVDVNVRGLQTLLAEVAVIGARLVFASSSSIYGDDDRRPFIESQARGRPESPYGATKVAGEALVHAHHAQTGLPIGVARLFTVYGPRQRPDLAIHTFARAILERRPIDLFDEGRGLRDYTYVDDVVDAIIRLADAADPFLVVNVGSHHPVETAAVVDELERVLGMVAERRLLPAQAGDVHATFADVSLAREVLGWEPTTPFSAGIERFCAWLRAEIDEAQASARQSIEPVGVGDIPPPTAT